MEARGGEPESGAADSAGGRPEGDGQGAVTVGAAHESKVRWIAEIEEEAV